VVAVGVEESYIASAQNSRVEEDKRKTSFILYILHNDIKMRG
jgi:hypothetical protein